MLIITKNKEILNLSLFKESLKERFNARSPSFYELTLTYILQIDIKKLQT